MIHVLDFDDNIIDYISEKNNYVTHANLVRSKEESTDTYDFIIDSDRAENMRERNRIIIQDRNGIYREYIIVNVADDIDDLTTVQCNASYVEDLTTAKPYKPGGFTKFTTTQALDDITKDTGWERAKDTEYGGIRTSTWTSYQTRYAVLQQMCTTYDMELDFYIELSSNSVAHRYVSLKSKNSLFKGKEIKFGKDLLSMTRTVDITDIHTALYAIGPEDDKGNRRELVVTDDDAQAQFGLDNRYIWGIYEPESDDAEMTEARLKTLATTQLNKDKQAAVSYEITSTDIANVYPHEIINFGDTVRIKDIEFNPPLYVEAEVIGETYDPIANESIFVFGNVKEFKESELRKDLYDRLASIQQKMNDNISNVNTIVEDVVAGQLEYFERKIIKSATPPENPVNDTLWYDTSNPEVAVLRRYWNGEWIEETADDVEKIGGITREKALFSELTNTFINLTIQHSRLQSDVYEIVSNEYLIDDDLRARVNTEFNKTTTTYNNIKTSLNSMTPETATIGKLIDTQAMFLNYREQLQDLYNVIQSAQRAIDARFKFLQSQYTDEKFNDAMQKVADKFGFELTSEGLLVGEGTLISGSIQALRDDTEEQFKTVLKKVDYETDKSNIVNRLDSADSERVQLNNQINDRVTLNEYRNMKIGTQNLLLNSKEQSQSTSTSLTHAFMRYYLTKPLEIGKEYTLISDVYKTSPEQSGNMSIRMYNPDNGLINVPIVNNKIQVTFISKVASKELLLYKDVAGSSPYTLDTNFKNTMLVEGNKIGDYEKAPEDTDKKLTTMQTQINQNGVDINQRATREEFNASKKTLSRVISDLTINTTTGLSLTYDENGSIQSHTVGPDGIKIKGDKVDIAVNKEFQVLAGNVSDKVGKGEIINRLNLSTEGLDINVNKIGIRGGDSSSYVQIANDIIELSGQFTRTWRGQTQKDIVYTRMKDGLLRFRNNSKDRSLYYSDFGVSTYVDGDGSEASGTLQFFDYTYSTARGVTLNSANGVVALSSNANRIILDANATVNLESETSSVYFRPMRDSRVGTNEFRMWVKDNDSGADTDGVLSYGSITSGSTYGSGIRFDKSSSTNYVYATNNNGDIGSGDFYARKVYGDWEAKSDNVYAMVNASLRITDKKGYNGGNPNYRDLQADKIQANSIRLMSNTNLYLGTSTGEVRVTNNLLYNDGNTGYKPLHASDLIAENKITYKYFEQTSSEAFKTDITEWNDNATKYIKESRLYNFKYKDDEYKRLNHGLIIERETPNFFVNESKKGVKTNEIIFTIFKALQEQIYKNDDLESRIKTLEAK